MFDRKAIGLSLIPKFQRAGFLETDTSEIVDEAVTVGRKGGTVASIGD